MAGMLDIAMPLIETVMYGFLAGMILIPFSYWYFILRLKRVWHATIWERHGTADLIKIGRDKVIEKKIKGKNAHLFQLKLKKYAVPPVIEQHVSRYKGKN